MIKYSYILLVFIFLQSCSTKPKNFKFYGDANYQESNAKNLNTNLNFEYSIPIYETRNKKFLFNKKNLIDKIFFVFYLFRVVFCLLHHINLCKVHQIDDLAA